MKSRLFLAVLLLATISTVGCPRDKQSQDAKEKATKAELERIYKLPKTVRSLVGEKEIAVYVYDLTADAYSAGLTKKQLREDVEVRLRRVGIKDISGKYGRMINEDVFINVKVNTVSNNDSPNTVFNVNCELSRDVWLRKYPSVSISASIWNKSYLGTCPKSEFPETARQSVKDIVDEFIKDYFKANHVADKNISSHKNTTPPIQSRR